MEEYCIVEFEDGLQMIPSSWLTESKTAARWPQLTSHSRFTKAVQKRIPYDNNWLLYDVKRILATAKTYEKGLVKLKKAEFVSDINSESDDYEDLKKSRKNRAKKVISSSDDGATDDKEVQVPPFPMIPQSKTYSKKINQYNNRQTEQLTENDSTNIHKEKDLDKSSMLHKEKDSEKSSMLHKEEDLEKSSMNSDSSNKMKKIYHDSVADNNKDKNENISSNDKSFDKFSKSNDASSSSSDFQCYIIRKLTNIGFKISSIEEQQKLFSSRLNTILQRIETIHSNERIQENESNDEHVMDNFPIDTIEDLEQFEKFVNEGIINQKELIRVLSRSGGNDVKGMTFNLLRKLITDKLGSQFSYVGGKKKRVFYNLQLRKIIFSVVRNQFAEATDPCIAEPIKSWLRHASERYLKKNHNEVIIEPGK